MFYRVFFRRFFILIMSLSFSSQAFVQAEDRLTLPNEACLTETGNMFYSSEKIGSLDQLKRRTPSCIWYQSPMEERETLFIKLKYYQTYLQEEAESPEEGLQKWHRLMANIAKQMLDYSCSDFEHEREDSLKNKISRRCQGDSLLSTIMANEVGYKQDTMPAEFSCVDNLPNCMIMIIVDRTEHMAFLWQTIFSDYKTLQNILTTSPALGKDVFLLVQHSDESFSFQKHALKYLKQAADEDLYPKRQIAKLIDRTLKKSDKVQRYGTQYTCKDGVAILGYPLESKENISQLRQWAGLEPLEETLQEQSRNCEH